MLSSTPNNNFVSTNGHREEYPSTAEFSDEKRSNKDVAAIDLHPGLYNEDDLVDTTVTRDCPVVPPPKRRKLADATLALGSHRSSPRPASPPWKPFSAEGPTSFVEDGRRKSGRTNAIPLEKQPSSGKRQTRARLEKTTEQQTRPNTVGKKLGIYGDARPKMTSGDKSEKRGPGRPSKSKTGLDVEPNKSRRGRPPTRLPDQECNSQSDVPTNSIAIRGHRAKLGRDTHEDKIEERYAGKDMIRPQVQQATIQKVKFRVALPKPAVSTPANIALPRRHPTFRDFLEEDRLESYAGPDHLSPEQIHQEARSRFNVYEARRHGLLHQLRSAAPISDRQNDQTRHFAHQDHLLGHIHNFRQLLRQEQKDHRKRAEFLALEAKRYVEEKQKQGRVKTVEELNHEHTLQMRALYRSVVKDLDRTWAAVEAEINAIRIRQHEEDRQARIKGHLNRVLDRTDLMLKRRHDSEIHDSSEVETKASSEESEQSDDDVSDSEDVSDTSSESDAEVQVEDLDAHLTAEQLQSKYRNLPSLSEKDEVSDHEMEDSAAAALEDETDPDTEMDSEFDSDESEGDEDAEDEDDENEDGAGGGLLSLFFSKKQLNEMSTENATQKPNQWRDSENDASPSVPLIEEMCNDVDKNTDGDASTDDRVQNILHRCSATSEPGHDTQEASLQISLRTSASKRTDAESISSVDQDQDNQSPDAQSQDKMSGKTQIPSLLRGTLREYQHEGLDWLANLYASGRSGILADEMGLGKTIQSIALLAHLATHYEVWGPHLIVVPTSVMLNWEMEFKKFLPGFKVLTYYGSLEERKQKRRGWMADDSFNVCITSYQLVLQDANSFKRRRWHYMILDEAHNIKNFRSERWQTMMTFNTRARLLLTGTPLQNNLTELWSLLFFLHYGQDGQDDDDAFAGLKEWSEWFKRPVESILEHGKQALDAEDKEQVAKLHKVIRPFLLRRLKADVEKQMPLKYEHVEMCRLSKRQRQLYDGFMSRAQTKETLASGNYLSIINALMQLRKVCNHPDLFETRPINTSFAMRKSAVADFEIKDLLIRRKMFATSAIHEVDLDFLQLVPVSNEKISTIENLETLRRHAYIPIKALRDSQSQRINQQIVTSSSSMGRLVTLLDHVGRKARLQDLDRTIYYEAYRHHQRPIYGRGLLKRLDINTKSRHLSICSSAQERSRFWEFDHPEALLQMVSSIATRSESMKSLVQQYACLTPAVVALDLNNTILSELEKSEVRQDLTRRPDPFHQSRMKLSIAFPDKRLLQYDCGKLQRLAKLLRELQAGGHRALIFTQMTKVLDILEQFLNIHGYRYLRLDGATKIEQRQILTDRFNNDTRILAFILSSRSGGLGINLTGADTVIFYDLDWNPAMDRQCTDRAHRIGQTRDVHIYRFVSEHTIESNILRKANQKQLLDDVVIQEGAFTTDYLNKLSYRDMMEDGPNDAEDAAGAAMDRVLGNDKNAALAFEQAEDKEDVSAAKAAAKEVQNADEADFEEKITATAMAGALSTQKSLHSADATPIEAESENIHHIDEYLFSMQTYLLKDVPLTIPKDRLRKNRRKGDEHRRRGPR